MQIYPEQHNLRQRLKLKLKMLQLKKKVLFLFQDFMTTSWTYRDKRINRTDTEGTETASR